MTTTTKAATNAAKKQENKKQVENYTLQAKVTKVMLSQGDNRVTLVFDKEFNGFDQSGEPCKTNMLGTNIYNLVNEIGSQVPYLQMADALAMGQPVNPQIVSLSLVNADVVVERVFKEKGEEREVEGTGTYTNDCFVSRFKKVTTHINGVFEKVLADLVMNKPTANGATIAAANANPFDIA